MPRSPWPEAVAGSEDAFVVQMNREAARIGMKSTRYANSHLPSPDNFQLRVIWPCWLLA